MKRALLLLPLVALVSCAQPGVGTVLVRGVCGPTTSCKFTGKCDAYVVVNPTIDSSVTNYLELFLEVANQLPDNGDQNNGRLNTNAATIEGANIEFGGALAGKVSVPVSGAIPSEGTSVVGVQVIPGAVGAALPGVPPAYPDLATVTARVRLHGHFADGSWFETSDFNVQIEVTTGAPQTATCATACPQAGQYPAGC
jgi:hypothetical protein